MFLLIFIFVLMFIIIGLLIYCAKLQDQKIEYLHEINNQINKYNKFIEIITDRTKSDKEKISEIRWQNDIFTILKRKN